MKRLGRILAFVSFGLCTAHWLHAAPFAYITHGSGVSVVDLGIRAVVAELPAGAAGGVAVNTSTSRAYVSGRDRVSVIDTRPQAVILTTALPTFGGGAVTLHPTRPEAYLVTDHCRVDGSPCTADLSVVVRTLNTDNDTLVDSFASATPARVAFSPDGLLMFLAQSGNTLSILNAATRQLIANVALAAPQSMAVDPSGRLLYVAETGAAGIAVIDVASRTLAGRIALGSAPSELALGGARLFVSHSGGNSVTVVDTGTRSVVGTVAVGAHPLGIDATPAGDQVVVANNGSASVTIIDALSLDVLATIGVGANPVAIGRFIGGTSAPQFPDVLTGLWWNPAESGWGVHVAQRGSRVFAAWFTYNASGAPKWYVSSDCTLNTPPPGPSFSTEVTCTGNLYETAGPRFFSAPYNSGAVNVNRVGLFQMGFGDRNTGAMSVVIGSTVKTMPLKRQVFRGDGPAPATDYTDLWWNPAESGWGIGITQQFGTMFLAWFAYDDSGAPAWYVASNCVVSANGNGCSGELYRTSGPPDPIRNPFDPSRVKVDTVGSIAVSFTDGNSGMMSYTVDGKSGTKVITRQLF